LIVLLDRFALSPGVLPHLGRNAWGLEAARADFVPAALPIAGKPPRGRSSGKFSAKISPFIQLVG
jgi:hypothetical protein